MKDDFVTWDEDKYELVKPVLWQDGDNKFIGLDHKVALGENGIALSDYSGSTPEAVFNDTPSDTDKPAKTESATVAEDPATEQGQNETEAVTESGASDKSTDTASDKPGSNRTLILILLGVFIVADIIVIFFIFKGKSSSEGNSDGRKEE